MARAKSAIWLPARAEWRPSSRRLWPDRVSIRASIGFVEAHGTGTALGDPIELGAITDGFRTLTSASGYCAVGSVKTNVGHLQIASGVAGFIKAALALYHKEIPPTLHFETPNPRIDFANSPFYVNNRLLDWSSADWPRRASVNSLGIGGTNAHVVLEEAPRHEPQGLSRQPPHVLPISARTPTALRKLIGRYREASKNSTTRLLPIFALRRRSAGLILRNVSRQSVPPSPTCDERISRALAAVGNGTAESTARNNDASRVRLSLLRIGLAVDRRHGQVAL